MALDPGLIADVAREYLRLIRRGATALAARTQTAARLGQSVSQQALTYIIAQANRAVQVGLNLIGLGQDNRLYDALGQQAPPSVNVGVNVVALITVSGGTQLIRPLYVRMQWHDTIAEIQPALEAMVDAIFGDKYNITAVSYSFNGPTLWDIPSSYL